MAITNLTGTKWTFNENVNLKVLINDGDTFEFNFKSNNQDFISFYSDWSCMSYYNENYDTNDPYIEGEGWTNQAYRTIEIIDGDDVENVDLIAFLQANATQIVEPTTNLVNLKYSKWVFNDNIDFAGFETSNYNIEFAINGSSYTLKINSEEKKLIYNLYGEDIVVYTENAWVDSTYKSIFIFDGKDKTNKDLIAFLEKNASLIVKVSSFINSKWLLHENLNGEFFDEYLNFKSNNKEFDALAYENGYGLNFNNNTTEEYLFVLDQQEGKNEWLNQAYRTIEITGGDALQYYQALEWIVNNATLLEEQHITLKSFLTDIANAIRETTHITEKINAQDFVKTILDNTPTIKKLIQIKRSSECLFSDYGNAYVDDFISYSDTYGVINMREMFWRATYLKEIPPLDTNDVDDMSCMFEKCVSLEFVPPLYTDKVTNMDSMFCECYRLPTIDITKLADNSTMFAYECHSLTKFIIRKMDTIPTYIDHIFDDCFHFEGTYHEQYNPDGLKDGRIYVPDDKVEELKATAGWSDYADIIVPLSTLDGGTSDTTIITFTLGNIGTFQAEEGMTWQQWVSSSYNTEGAFISRGNVIASAGANVQYNGVNVKETDTIIANATYQLYMDMGDF